MVNRLRLVPIALAALIALPTFAKGPIGDAVTSLIEGPKLTPEQHLARLTDMAVKQQGVPKMVNAETRWRSMTTKGLIVTYDYVLVNWTAQTLDVDDFVKAMNPTVQGFCSDAGAKAIFQYNGTIRFAYSGSDGAPIKTWELSPKTCRFAP